MRRHRTPIRLRLTLAYTAAMLVVLAIVIAVVYARTKSDLLDAVDSGMRSRAEVLVAEVNSSGPGIANVEANLIETDEAFAQVAGSTGRIVQSSRQIAGSSLLPSTTVASVRAPTFFDRTISGIDGTTRVLAVPVDTPAGHWVVLVGASLQDRNDAVQRMAEALVTTGLVTLGLSAFAGWLVAGSALRPIERLRRDAAAIQASDFGRRLEVAGNRDEIERLGTTLNVLLDRLQSSVAKERHFLDNASHELRTPVTILKGELELALSRPRTAAELEAAVLSAAEEAEHLGDLADGLLLLSRVGNGGLGVHREQVDVAELARYVVGHAEGAAHKQGLRLQVEGSGVLASVDRTRVRQALDNLLSNAVRHTTDGGLVRVQVSRDDELVRLVVEDTGSGFPVSVLATALDPFTSGPGSTGSGLGLSIVKAMAEAHGGGVQVGNVESGGARVVVTLADSRRPPPGPPKARR